jgi:succinyl-diaminopimelate desuccinylase
MTTFDPTSSASKERLAELSLELVRIPSVTGDETAITDHLEAWARGLKQFPAEMITRQGNGLVVGRPDQKRPCVALVGHTDTVPPHEGDPEPGIEGDRLTGLGASDMKSSLAVMQLLCETLALDELPFCLMLLFYDKEEGPFADSGLQPLLDNCPWLQEIDLAIAMEPTDNTLQLGCLGGLQASVRVEGKSAHSARPWQGENAIHKAGPLLTQLLERPYPEVEVEGLVFRNCMSATLATGGRARNVVPDSFELNINYRFAPTSPVADAIEAAKKTVLGVCEGAHVEFTDISPPGPVPQANPILEHLKETTHLPLQPKQAWTDVARLAAHSIDAINFGPGYGAQCHQAGEYASLEMIQEAYVTLHAALSTPLQGA